MKVKNIVHVGQLINNLTMTIVKTTSAIKRTQKLFSECKIVLDEKSATDFRSALTKLFAQINSLEKEDID